MAGAMADVMLPEGMEMSWICEKCDHCISMPYKEDFETWDVDYRCEIGKKMPSTDEPQTCEGLAKVARNQK